MFYSHTLFSRNGPLGTIWIAAFFFKKLKKEQIAHTDISSSIDEILPESQMPYRILAQLLLGIVRIFSKKVDYLYNDCNEALIYIRKSFATGQYKQKRAVARSQTRVKETNEGARDKYRIKETNASTRDMYMIEETNENTNRVKETNESTQDKIITESKENMCMQPEEAMFAPHDHATIIIPERFELDTFDLGDLDNGDAARSYEQSSDQDHILKGDIGDLFLEQGHMSERYVNEDYNYACFTPVNEVHPSNVMDIDLEISDECNLSIVNVRGEVDIAEKRHLEPVKNNESLPPQSPNATKEPREYINEAKISLPLGNLETNKLNEEDKSLPVKRLDEGNESLVPQSPADGNESLPPKMINEESNILIQPIQSKMMARSNHEKHSKDHSLSVETLPNRADLPALVDEESKPKVYSRSHDKSPLRDDLGIPSPKLMLITPARKEQWRTSQKRKRIFDEKIVLSNETLRRGIHDSSSLIHKRQKAPKTLLEVWRVSKISTLHESFLDPLIPIAHSKLKFVREAKSAVVLTKKSPSDCNVESTNVDERTCMEVDCLSQERLLKEQQETATEEHRERLLEEHQDRVHEVHQDKVSEFIDAESYSEERRANESYEASRTDSELDLMDRECGSNEKAGVDRDHGWSVKTSSVAKYLLRKFQLEGGVLSLGQILQGKTRAKCARLFFETLFLKGKDCIDAKQEYPYGDIILSATHKLEEELKS